MLTFNPPAWLKEKQLAAQMLAEKTPAPKRREESWRYSDPEQFSNTQYVERPSDEKPFELPREAAELQRGADHTLCFYNGEFISQFSAPSLTEDILIAPLNRVLMSAGRIQDLAKNLLNYEVNPNLKKLSLKNSANFKEGALIHLRTVGKAAQKIAVLNFYGKSPQPFIVYPKNIYNFAEFTKAEVFEAHISVNNIAYQVNSSADILLGEGAQVAFTQVIWPGDEALMINDVRSEVKKAASLQFLNLTIGGKISRNELGVKLLAAGAEVEAYSLYLANNKQCVDNNSFIQHIAAHTKSLQIAKGILAGEARVAFAGHLKIHEDAQKSDAKQLNNNLLLSDQAEASSKPQLEVYADDVKAAHGTTVGQLNPDELFYLMSRAIPKSKAQEMLARGYLLDVVAKISGEFLRTKITAMIDSAADEYLSMESQ